jgi:hypothetical protein
MKYALRCVRVVAINSLYVFIFIVVYMQRCWIL